MSLTWSQEPVDGKSAAHLRREVRARRREKGRGGHRYVFRDLKELHVVRRDGEVVYAVLTHHEDPMWQLWGWQDDKGWMLLDWYEKFPQATRAAERHVWPVEEQPPAPVSPGIYVLAGWARPNTATKYTMRVHCRSKTVAIAVAEAFHRVGAVTEREEVFVQ